MGWSVEDLVESESSVVHDPADPVNVVMEHVVVNHLLEGGRVEDKAQHRCDEHDGEDHEEEVCDLSEELEHDGAFR